MRPAFAAALALLLAPLAHAQGRYLQPGQRGVGLTLALEVAPLGYDREDETELGLAVVLGNVEVHAALGRTPYEACLWGPEGQVCEPDHRRSFAVEATRSFGVEHRRGAAPLRVELSAEGAYRPPPGDARGFRASGGLGVTLALPFSDGKAAFVPFVELRAGVASRAREESAYAPPPVLPYTTAGAGVGWAMPLGSRLRLFLEGQLVAGPAEDGGRERAFAVGGGLISTF